MASGRGWNLWVWLTGGWCRWNLWMWLYGDILQLYNKYYALFGSSILFFSFKTMFFVLVPVLFCNLCKKNLRNCY